MQIALPGWIVPFMAVYAPALMLQPVGPRVAAYGFVFCGDLRDRESCAGGDVVGRDRRSAISSRRCRGPSGSLRFSPPRCSWSNCRGPTRPVLPLAALFMVWQFMKSRSLRHPAGRVDARHLPRRRGHRRASRRLVADARVDAFGRKDPLGRRLPCDACGARRGGRPAAGHRRGHGAAAGRHLRRQMVALPRRRSARSRRSSCAAPE